MMRTLSFLAACCLLIGSASAADELANGSFHLVNHPDGGWIGVDAADPGTQVAYGMILAGHIENKNDGLPEVTAYPIVVFDFNDAVSSMKLRYSSSNRSVTVSGQAVAWASLARTKSNMVYSKLGVATIEMTYENGVLAPGGEYQDIAFTTAAGSTATGRVTMPAGDVYALGPMADVTGLYFQFGDWEMKSNGLVGHRVKPEDADYWSEVNGKFSQNKGGKDGSGGQPKDNPTGGEQNGTGAGWLNGGSAEDGEREPVEEDAKPRDFLFGGRGRGAEAPG